MDTQNRRGGLREGAGRKKGSVSKGEHKTGRLVISCLESEEAEIRRLAAASGKTVSRYIVDILLQGSTPQ